MDSQQFLTLLQNLTSANNQLRKSAEITFNALKATALPDLLYTFLNSLLLDIPHDLKLLICILLVICSSVTLLLLYFHTDIRLLVLMQYCYFYLIEKISCRGFPRNFPGA